MKNLLWLILLIACDQPTTRTNVSKAQEDSLVQGDSLYNAALQKISDKNDEDISPWNYSVDSDKMDGSKTYFAAAYSTNTLNFNFPYSGGSTGTLTVRKRSGLNEVYLQISQGQFLDNISEDRVMRLKFDESKPITISYSGTSDYRSDAIFLGSPQIVISKLKKSKSLLLEVEFYNEGRQQLDFNVKNLQWNH